MGNNPFLIFNNSPSGKRGVAVVVKKNNDIVDAEIIFKQKDGNAIGVKIVYTFGPLIVYSIYGPNSRDDSFYRELGDEISRAGRSFDGIMVVGGDWNVVPSGLPPQVNPDLIDSSTEPNPINAEAVRRITEENGLEDIYRVRHGEQRSYTFKHFSGKRVARSRLDFFLTSRQKLDPRKPQLIPRILPRLCNSFDHRAIEVCIVKKPFDAQGNHRRKRQTIPNSKIITEEAAEVIFKQSALGLAFDHLRVAGAPVDELIPTLRLLTDTKKHIIRLVKLGGKAGKSFGSWKEFRNEDWFLSCKTVIDDFDWDEIWTREEWKQIEGAGVMGDLVITSGANELGCFQELVLKEEKRLEKNLNQKLRELDNINADHNSAVYRIH